MNTLPQPQTGQWARQGQNGDCPPSSPTQDRQAASVVTVCGFTGEPSLFQTAGPQEQYPSPCFYKAWLKKSRHNHLPPLIPTHLRSE